MSRVATGVVTLVLALALAGCAGTPAGSPPGDPTSSSSSSADPTPTPTVEWVSYQTPDGSASWEMPADWTVTVGSEESYATGETVPTYTILDEDAVARVALNVHIGGIGGPGCEVMSPLYPYTLLDSAEPASSVPGHVWYETIDGPSGVTAALHLVPSDTPEPTESCGPDWGFVPTDELGIISWRALVPLTEPVDQRSDPDAYAALPTDEAGGVISFADPAEAQAFMDTELYQTLRRILSSLEITSS